MPRVAKTEKSSSRGAVLPCSCSNEYQDKRYGAGNRLHTTGKKGHTCTVCGKPR